MSAPAVVTPEGAREGERIRGVDAALPPGERVRWQGSPEWRALAVHVFHVRKVAVYFALLLAWRAALAAGEPRPLAYFATGAATLAGALAAAVAILCAVAWWCARSTTYAVTDRRLVLHAGMVVPTTLNIPLKHVESASLKTWRDGTGDLALALEGSDRLAYFLLWPHARPWRFNPTQPALRCVADPHSVGAVLRQAVSECVDAPLSAPEREPAPAREPVPAMA